MSVSKAVKMTFVTGVLIYSGSTLASAVPTLYSQCPGVQIVEPVNSSGFYMSEDCQTAYVLPYRVNSMRVSIDQYSSTLDSTCNQIGSLERTLENYTASEELLSSLATSNAERITQIQDYINRGLLPVGQTVQDLQREMLETMGLNRQIQEELHAYFRYYTERMELESRRVGASGRFTVENQSSDLIQEFERLNPQWQGTFRAMNMGQSVLSISQGLISREGDSAYIAPFLLDVIVPGPGAANPVLRDLGFIVNQEFDGEAVETNSTSVGSQGVNIFNGALGGSFTFTGFGACAARDNVSNLGSFQVSEMGTGIAANALYQYQVRVNRSYSISFRMDELFKVIQEQTRRGGFFSRRTLNSLIDEKTSNSWVDFHVQSEDAHFEYTDEEIKDIKKDLLDRALRQVVSALGGSQGVSALALIQVSGDTGATTIANELNSCRNLYCRIGQSGLRILGAIFGSDQAVSSLTKTFSAEIRETVTESEMVTRYGTMTFE